MLTSRQEEDCPVSADLLGDIFKTDAGSLRATIESIPPFTRALLALYCRGQSHLSGAALTIAGYCTRQDLVEAGGSRGVTLYEQARERPTRAHLRLVAQDLI